MYKSNHRSFVQHKPSSSKSHKTLQLRSSSRAVSTQKRQMDTSARSQRIQNFGESIFSKMTMAAIKNNAVNLGQGAPDDQPEQFVKQRGAEALLDQQHQYTRAQGFLPLCQELADFYGQRWNRKIDATTEIGIGQGATEVGFSLFHGILNPGDEVVLFEPYFDCYQAWADLAGVKVTHVKLEHITRLQSQGKTVLPDVLNTYNQHIASSSSYNEHHRSDDYTFDMNALKDAITPKTRILLVNNPHNPLGKLFSRSELEYIAQLAHSNPNLIVVSDEVYENLVHTDTLSSQQQHDNATHNSIPSNNTFIPFATVDPTLWNQIVTISSAGKTFSITGWKIGWAIGPAHIIEARNTYHSWVTFCVSTPLQLALMNILKDTKENGYMKRLADNYTQRRDMLYNGLKDAGLNPIYPSAGYFVVCDLSNNKEFFDKLSIDTTQATGVDMALDIVQKVGVASIPIEKFYHPSPDNADTKYLFRFAYCKNIDAIKQGLDKLSDFVKKE